MSVPRLKFSAAALLLSFAGSALACNETGAFGFRFEQPVPSNAKFAGGGSKLSQHVVSVPDPYRNFTTYQAWAYNNKRVVYQIDAMRETGPASLMNTPADNPERQRVKDAARAEVVELVKHFGEQHGLQFKKIEAGEHYFFFRAETPVLEAEISVEGIRYIKISCMNRQISSRESAIWQKENGGRLW